jgi:acyl carrier protein
MEALEDTIRMAVCTELKLPLSRVSNTTNLRELPGMDSVRVLRIIAKIERAHDVELDDEIVFGVGTVEDIAAAIRDLAPLKTLEA